jgi:hypothetical protein
MGRQRHGGAPYDPDQLGEPVAREHERQLNALLREAAEGDLLDEATPVETDADAAAAEVERLRQLDAAHRREASEADLLDATEVVEPEPEPSAPAGR